MSRGAPRLGLLACALVSCAPELPSSDPGERPSSPGAPAEPDGVDGVDGAPVTTLPTPPAAVDLNPDPDVVEVELLVTEDAVALTRDRWTEVLAYRDGAAPESAPQLPGPLIEAKRGDRLIIHLRNELELEATTLHLHGVRLPAELDGNPMVSGATFPGESYTADLVLRDAGLFWYHPHINTETQMARGLKGPILVHEPDAPPVDAERVLVLDAVDLDDDAQLRIDASDDDIMFGRRGDLVLVNGAPRPTLVTTAGTTERWRVVNASNGRFFELALAGAGLTVIGGDGGPAAAPRELTRLPIAPGERLDVLVRYPDVPSDLTLESLEVPRGHGGIDPAITLMDVLLDEPAASVAAAPSAFTRPLARLPVDDATPLRTLELSGELDGPLGPVFRINEQVWPFNDPIYAELGAVERWRIVNTSPGDHPFHLHGAFFQVIARDGAPREPDVWKDTVAIGPEGEVTLAVRHEAPGRWMFHCQIPEHADRGMMGDLIVAAP